MKAIDLAKALLDGWLNIEQGGLMVMDAPEDGLDSYCEGYFGTYGKWEGVRDVGATYFYYYMPDDRDDEDVYRIMGCKPDAWSIRPDECDMVALWKIE